MIAPHVIYSVAVCVVKVINMYKLLRAMIMMIPKTVSNYSYARPWRQEISYSSTTILYYRLYRIAYSSACIQMDIKSITP